MNKIEITKDIIKDEFLKKYGKSNNEVRVFASPARINIIGEHIDYNGGKVFPSAINKYLYVAIRKRNDSSIIYNDFFYPGEFKFSITDDFTFAKQNDYANYLNGILSIIKRKNYTIPCGFEVLIASNVPSAGGISSSSALECGFAYAVSSLFDLNISRKEIALIGQQSEHEFMNVNCGIMDQFIIATAKKNTAELLDCNTIEYEYVPLELGDYRFIVMNTKKQRRLADSKYNERRSECEKGLKTIQSAAIPLDSAIFSDSSKIKNLCDLTFADYKKCENCLTDEIIKKRVRHCVSENERVLKAVDALKNNDLIKLGKLLYESHESLKNDYEVTGLELDSLKELASKQEGCIGARMTGAGFGGCAIAIVKKDKTDDFIKNVGSEYKKIVGYEGDFFTCESGEGCFEC